MKVKLLLAVLIFVKFNTFSQSKGDYYISKSNDTIHCKILDFNSKRVFVSVNGEKIKFVPVNIKSIVIHKKGTAYKFVSLINDKQNFYREIILGKLSFYNLNDPNMSYPIMVKDDKIVWLNVLNPSKRISELISDCPELYKEWTEGEKYTLKDKEAIVNAYNKCISNNE